jgi:hypothetical protein
MAELETGSHACENCGARLPAGAVLCVQCGYDIRQGGVLGRTAPHQGRKKRKKPPWLRFGARNPVTFVALGAPLLVGLGVFVAFRGGGLPSTPENRTRAVGSTRPLEPSRDQKDWRTSFVAFAANLTAQYVTGRSGRSTLEVRSGSVGWEEDGGKIQWEGVLLGRDRRPIASAAAPESPQDAFGFRMPDSALPEPFVVLFAIDASQAPELLKLGYRRVRIEGNLQKASRVVWLDQDGYISNVVDGPALRPGEASYIEPPGGAAVKPLVVMWFRITRFELAN